MIFHDFQQTEAMPAILIDENSYSGKLTPDGLYVNFAWASLERLFGLSMDDSTRSTIRLQTLNDEPTLVTIRNYNGVEVEVQQTASRLRIFSKGHGKGRQGIHLIIITACLRSLLCRKLGLLKTTRSSRILCHCLSLAIL